MKVDVHVNSEELKVQLEAFRGPQGPAGEDYILTDADKREIAGMVEVQGGGSVELDTTLSVSGKAADAGAVGEALNELNGANEQQDERLIALERISANGGTGISETARNLLITILREGVYSSDQSANIAALNVALGGTTGTPDEPDIPTIYAVTHKLSNVSVSNDAMTVEEGSAYTTTLKASDGYTIDTVTVTMGGTDITASVYADGVITISAVTGNVVITATAVSSGGDSGESEILEIVPSTSYPNVTTFEWKEGSVPGQYSVAKQGTIKGGTLYVDYNTEECNNWNMNLYVFGPDGNPYCQTDVSYSGNNVYYKWGENELPGWEDVGAGSGFGAVVAPFSVKIPDGCTFIACMRRGNVSTGDGIVNASNGAFAEWACTGGITFTVKA